MTRNIVIGAINLAIAAIIGINALLALMGGCSIGGGRCDGSSNVLTWGLAIVMPAIVIVGGFLLVRAWRKSASAGDREIAFKLPLRAPSHPGIDVSDDDADDAMSARLARTTTAAHVIDLPDENAGDLLTADNAVDDADYDAPYSSPSTDRDFADSNQSAMDDCVPEQLNDDRRWMEPFTAEEGSPTILPPAPSHHPSDQWAVEDIEDAPDDGQRALDWLVEGDEQGFAPLLRTDSGFPWVVAGIDHVCAGVARIGHRLVGTDYPAEAAAWRQVVGGLSRHDPLGGDDSLAFIDWVNGILDASGDAGLDLVEDALHELGVEAATNPQIAAHLPADVTDFREQRAGDQVLRRTK